jgi:hypothetical protein
MKIDFDKMVSRFRWEHGPGEEGLINDENMGYLFRWAINHQPVPTIREQIENLREEFLDKAAEAWKYQLDTRRKPDDEDNTDIRIACDNALGLLNTIEEAVDLIDEAEASIATRRNSS